MEQAQEELEVHFCNICNASIPESALRDGKAVRIDDKVLPTASGEIKTSSGGGGVLAGAFVLLVGIAAAAMFLDWRISQESQRQSGSVAGFSGSVERLSERLDQIEARLGSTLSARDMAPLIEQLEGFHANLLARDAQDAESRQRIGEQSRALQASLESMSERQVKLDARVAMLHEELRAVGQDLAALKAAPVATAKVPGIESLKPTDTEGSAESASLPPEIARHAERLGDEDDGVRFDAVERLLDIGEPEVFPLIMPLVKDKDLWVRRLVIEGLARYQAGDAVEALIDALGDDESIVRYEAHNSLLKLTGADIKFDSDGSRDQRAAGQRRWQQWWERNRAEF